MNRKEFFEWLETCPSHKWEVVHDEVGYVWVAFDNIDEHEDDGEDAA